MGTAECIEASDVTFELYNKRFNNLSVVYMSKTDDLVPDNGVSIAQGWLTANVTLFVAGAETDGMYIDVNRT